MNLLYKNHLQKRPRGGCRHPTFYHSRQMVRKSKSIQFKNLKMQFSRGRIKSKSYKILEQKNVLRIFIHEFKKVGLQHPPSVVILGLGVQNVLYKFEIELGTKSMIPFLDFCLNFELIYIGKEISRNRITGNVSKMGIKLSRDFAL